MDLKNKLCIVTGANSGIGKEIVRAFARQGAYVIMICRNEKRALKAQQELIQDTGHSGIEVMLADLALQHDIRSVAKKTADKFNKIDVLVNNAGLISGKREETIDGIERTLAVNHLAPFLLTNLLLDQLKKAAEARVINVASEAHRYGVPFFDLENLQLKTGYKPMVAYGFSKLCNILFTRELAKRCEDSSITTNCLHPGVVGTGLAEEASLSMKILYTIGRPFMRSPRKGAETTIYLATSNEVQNISGKYFKDKKIASPASIATDDELAKKLWDISAGLTNLS
ncbi:MAG TPA: SDR family oxidoreductase [Balneolaceae bacterium]|nr:SDR family oxidoreductase [Balneolaceae bacterium]